MSCGTRRPLLFSPHWCATQAPFSLTRFPTETQPEKNAVCWTEVLAEPSHSPELLRLGFNSRPSSEEADAAGLAPFSCGLGDLEVVFSSLSPERKSMVSGSMYDLTFARFSFFSRIRL